MSRPMTWEVFEDRFQAFLLHYRSLRGECEALQKRLSSLEAEMEGVRSLRMERDKLKSERDVVKRRVLEMLQQLEKVPL